MKTRAVVSILILVLAVMIISSCATTPKTQEEREGINPEIFFQSVKAGDYAEVKRLIEAEADVNAQDNNGFTVLMLASANGHIDVAQLLIEEGADVNAQDKIGATALIVASRRGQTYIVKLLIEAGADVNAQTNDGGTALMFASQDGHTEVVKLLIHAGAK